MITLEEQIEHMRELISTQWTEDSKVSKAILATLEAVRDTKVSVCYKDGEIVGIRKEQK